MKNTIKCVKCEDTHEYLTVHKVTNKRKFCEPCKNSRYKRQMDYFNNLRKTGNKPGIVTGGDKLAMENFDMKIVMGWDEVNIVI